MIYNRAEKGELFDHLTDQVTLSEKKTRWETVNTGRWPTSKSCIFGWGWVGYEKFMQIDRMLSALADETSDITSSYLMIAKFNNLVSVYYLFKIFLILEQYICFSYFYVKFLSLKHLIVSLHFSYTVWCTSMFVLPYLLH